MKDKEGKKCDLLESSEVEPGEKSKSAKKTKKEKRDKERKDLLESS